MDRRVLTLIGSAVVLVLIVAVVLIGRDGDDSEEAPEDDPPSELEIEDLEEGKGAEAKEGDQLSVDYVGTLYDTGEEFDNSYDTGRPLDVVLGEGGVIPGFEQGLEGMKEGGKRQITIPPDLGYGAQGQPPAIPPDSTLIFEVELVSIK